MLAMLKSLLAGAALLSTLWPALGESPTLAGAPRVFLARQDAEEETPDKSAATPHFWQLNPEAELANGGKNYCAPVAVANALVCLARQGAHALANADGDFESMTTLIQELASEDYCGTDPVEGTTPAKLLSGVQQYVEAQGYSCRLEYKGWRPVGAEQANTVRGKLPDTAWLAKAVAQPFTAVWLNIGWYSAGAEEGEFKRTGGHWVCVVACDDDTEDAPAFRIRNSLLRKTSADGGEDDEESVQFTQLGEGEAVDNRGNRRALEGTFQLAGPGLPLRKGVTALLDAAVVMKVRKE